MRCFAGLDISLETTSICVLAADGSRLREGVVETGPETIASWLTSDGSQYGRVGMESTSMATWLYTGLAKAGLPAVMVEARHAHSVLKARPNKTDRNDARGLAEIMRMGVFRAVHPKTDKCRAFRYLLSARRMLSASRHNVENCITGILRSAGINLRRPAHKVFSERVMASVGRDRLLLVAVKTLLRVHATVTAQMKAVEVRLEKMAFLDPVCRRLMTVPGIGPVTALTYRTTIDVPERFRRSRTVAAHLGLTPRTHQSGSLDWRGPITRFGDKACRTALCQAAAAVLNPRCRSSPLKAWAMSIKERSGWSKAMVALARRLAVLLHRIWIDGSVYHSA